MKMSVLRKAKVDYKKLNSRQKENHNFQVASALLAQYGYSCLRLTDDWEGADFIANHIKGNNFLKVQLKSRLCFAEKYLRKKIYIAFLDKNKLYLYPHDDLLKFVLKNTQIKKSDSWKKEKLYSFRSIPGALQGQLEKYYMGEIDFVYPRNLTNKKLNGIN